MSESEKKDNNKDYLDTLDWLGLDDKDVKSKSQIQIETDKNISEKVTKINSISMNYKFILEGKSFIPEDNVYKQTSLALAGKRFINLSYSILNSFSEESNLITKKDMDKFIVQFEDAFVKVNDAGLLDRTISEKDLRLIIKIFKDKLMNIGDIITGSSGNMDKVFTKYQDDLDNDRNFNRKI